MPRSHHRTHFRHCEPVAGEAAPLFPVGYTRPFPRDYAFDLRDDVNHERPLKLRPQIWAEGWKLDGCFCPSFEEPFSAPLRTNA